MLHLRPMTAADVPFGLALSRQAGWNQLESDWQRCLALEPDGCFLAEWAGRPAGTTATLVFGSVAWVALVLVEESLRGRGIGRALMSHALDYLDRRGILSVRLDATPLGQPLYERLGFVEQYRLARYAGTLPPSPQASAEPADPADHAALLALDAAATGADRSRLLRQLFVEQFAALRLIRRDGRPVGYMTSRPGHHATQLGPCIADAEAGLPLLADAWQRHAGHRVFIDLPLANETACRSAEAHGLTVHRHLTRMCRGKPSVEDVAYLWASAGPEKG